MIKLPFTESYQDHVDMIFNTGGIIRYGANGFDVYDSAGIRICNWISIQCPNLDGIDYIITYPDEKYILYRIFDKSGLVYRNDIIKKAFEKASITQLWTHRNDP